MYVEQIYTDCLAEAAYYIESNGEAAIIDPLRETSPYTDLAEKRGARIKYVFETHFHADFVSGHIDLARKTGADIVYGPTANAAYDVTVAEDEQVFPLGDVQIKVLHTPGHTMESSCFLLVDENGKEHAVFTGDTLFIGDVGRPDLAVKTDLSREDLARYLYNSINEKLLKLDDDVIVYPGHGAGSQCGKSLSSEKQSTIGAQKQFNYALQVSSEEEFVQKVTEGLNTPPQYFPKNAVINKTGYDSIDEVMARGLTAFTPEEFAGKMGEQGVVVIDSRSADAYNAAHLEDSINIGLDGFFAVWVGTLIEDLNTPILIIANGSEVEATVLRFARVGYENVIGYLKGGISTWLDAGKFTESTTVVSADDFKSIEGPAGIIDVRNLAEYEDGHVEGSINIPLKDIAEQATSLDTSKPYYVYCKSGYRSSIACSMLKKAGVKDVTNVAGGYDAVMGTTCSLEN